MELNGTIFLQVFIFLSLLIWLSRTLFAPILRLFDERELRIDGAKRIASEMSNLADEKAKRFAVEYERAKMEARHALAEQKNRMEREHAEALDKVKAEARNKMLAAEAELGQQENKIREELKSKTDAMANDMVQAMVRPAV